MSFNSYKPLKKRNMTIKYFLIFIFLMTSVLLYTNALNLVTGIENATQYIKEIILTNDGTIKGTTGIILDGNTSGGRIGSELYCTLNFDKCINIKGLIQTGDINGFLKTGDLELELNNFKLENIDTPLLELSGKVSGISGSLSLYAKLAELSNYTTIGDTEKINTDTTELFNTLNTIITNYKNGATTLSTLFVGVDNITRQ